VSWHTFGVLLALGFLASVALFAAFEVVVLAFAALPASFGELEVSPRWKRRKFLGVAVGVGRARAGGVVLEHLVDWLDTTGLSNLREVSCIGESLLWHDELLHVWEECLSVL
jgi:hypothetical protein